MKIVRKLGVVSFLLLWGVGARAQTLRVAAAADLHFAMNELGSKFEKNTGTKVAISYGSSGNFRAQIENGAPFDVFFSADAQYPRQLVSAGVADGQSLTVYAVGHLVVWAPADANLRLGERGFEALKDGRVKKIAIANPEHAPYGRAAVETLQKAGVYEQVKSKLVYGENISQAAQFAQSGSAQAGMIARSLTFSESMKGGEVWEIPAEFYSPLLQEAVIVQASPNKIAAKAFLEFVKSDEGRKILSKYGLTPPESMTKP